MNSVPGEPPAPDELVLPRLYTPPLRPLTPATSYGYDVVDFARDVCGQPLDPWERWSAIHLGELLPDGRPRFRTVLILVARQNGKTVLGRILLKYWIFVEDQPYTLATSTDRTKARRLWTRVVNDSQNNPLLAARMRLPRFQQNEELLSTIDGAEFQIAANNASTGRSESVDRWLCDELRMHKDFTAWEAATNATNARPYAQTVAISNQGGDTAIVLDSVRDDAIAYLESGEGDGRTGLLEWSSPTGCEPDDPAALRAANPSHRIDLDALVAAGRRAARAGGQVLAGHRTEVMCQRVTVLDPAIDEQAWTDCGTDEPVDLAQHRTRVALCLDVSLAGDHASMLAAAEIDGLVHVDVVRAWDGLAALRQDLPDLVRRVRPRRLGWLPNGPAAVVLADLTARRRAGWPPRGCELVPVTGDAAAACMGLAALVGERRIRHPQDPLLDRHQANATWQRFGDRRVFARRGAGPVDGMYAMAGAVHLARTLPPAPPALAAL